MVSNWRMIRTFADTPLYSFMRNDRVSREISINTKMPFTIVYVFTWRSILFACHICSQFRFLCVHTVQVCVCSLYSGLYLEYQFLTPFWRECEQVKWVKRTSPVTFFCCRKMKTSSRVCLCDDFNRFQAMLVALLFTYSGVVFDVSIFILYTFARQISSRNIWNASAGSLFPYVGFISFFACVISWDLFTLWFCSHIQHCSSSSGTFGTSFKEKNEGIGYALTHSTYFKTK